MASDWRIVNARLFDPAVALDSIGWLRVATGRIAALGTGAPPPDTAQQETTIDAQGMLLTPGFIDGRARLAHGPPELGWPLATEGLAAAGGGITTLLIPPTTEARLNSTSQIERILEMRHPERGARTLPVCDLLRGENALSEFGSLSAAGAVAAGNSHYIVDSEVLLNAMNYVSSFGGRLLCRARDGSLGRGMAHRGAVSARLGIPAQPEVAETLEVTRWCLLAEHAGVNIHFSVISCARSLEIIRTFRAGGLSVTADVCIHNLLHNEHQIGRYDHRFFLSPPLRAAEDRDALLAAVRGGELAVVSNHRPLPRTQTMQPFSEGQPGASATETLFSNGMRLVRDGQLSLAAWVMALTATPATAHHLHTARLEAGYPADLALTDLDANWTPNADILRSSVDNCIEAGLELPAVVRRTWVGGVEVGDGCGETPAVRQMRD